MAARHLDVKTRLQGEDGCAGPLGESSGGVQNCR
jgi:hypothetical protein